MRLVLEQRISNIYIYSLIYIGITKRRWVYFIRSNNTCFATLTIVKSRCKIKDMNVVEMHVLYMYKCIKNMCVVKIFKNQNTLPTLIHLRRIQPRIVLILFTKIIYFQLLQLRIHRL